MFISLFAVIALYFSVSHITLLAILFWAMAIAVAWYFRDPRRVVPASPLAVVVPVDGVVTGIEESEDTYVGRQSVRVTLQKPWHSVMTLRSPMEGKIQKQWFGSNNPPPSIELQAENPQPIAAESKRFAQWVQSDEGDDVCVSLIPLSKSRFFRCYVHAGERIGQGQRCGIYPLSAMVEVRLPINSQIHVKVGDSVKAGSDKLATLVH